MKKIGSKFILPVFLTLFILLFRPGLYFAWSWHAKFELLLCLASIVIAVISAKKISWFLLPFLLIALVGSSALSTWSTHFNLEWFKVVSPLSDIYRTPYSPIGTALQCAGDAWMFLVAGLFVLIHSKPSFNSRIRFSLILIWWLNTIMMVSQFDVIPSERGGFVGTGGMSAALLATLLPFVIDSLKYKEFKFIAIGLTALCCYMSQSSIPIGVLIVALMSYFWKSQWRKPMILCCGSGFIASCFLISKFLDDSYRFKTWLIVFKWWSTNINEWFGAGYGTGLSLIQYAQREAELAAHHTVFDAFLWMHSDFLQILFETGIIGFLSVLLANFAITYRARKNPALFATWLSFSANAVFNYPLHSPIHALCFLATLSLVINNREHVST